jgi:hypothetical protein
MATEGPGRDDGCNYVAGADLSTKQFYGAVDTGTNTAGLQTSAGGRIIGIIQNKPKLGEAISVRWEGVSKAAAGATFGAAIELAVDATGRFIAAATGNAVVARSLEAAGAIGAIVSVRLNDTGYIKP